MHRSRFLWVVAALSAAWLARHVMAGPQAPRVWSDYGVVPAFSLIDQHGRPVGRGDFEGSVWVADFIFTRCAGQCPLMSSRMAALQRQSERFGDRVRYVSFSVDPGYDTPERLAAYGAHYGADPRRWRFVTEARGASSSGDAAGVVTTIAALARRGFRLSASQDGPPDEPITHSGRLVLIDQRGVIRGYYDAEEPQAVARLLQDVRALLDAPAVPSVTAETRPARAAAPLPAAR